MGLAEVADRAEVRNVLADDDPTGDVGLTAAHDFPRGTSAGGVAIQKQRDHHPGVERRLSPQFALIMSEDGGEVERGDGIDDEVDQIVLGQPVARRGRKHIGLVRRPLAIGLAHATISPYQVTGNHRPPDYSNLAFERQYSDRLLAARTCPAAGAEAARAVSEALASRYVDTASSDLPSPPKSVPSPSSCDRRRRSSRASLPDQPPAPFLASSTALVRARASSLRPTLSVRSASSKFVAASGRREARSVSLPSRADSLP